jgi:hypothetical protein
MTVFKLPSRFILIYMNTFEKITKHIEIPSMIKVCGARMTKDERINFMSAIILEISKEKDGKFLAEIIHELQRKLFEYENSRWKIN